MGLSGLYLNRNLDLSSNRNNLDDSKFIISKTNEFSDGRIVRQTRIPKMKTYSDLYSKVICFENIYFTWKKARKNKTNRPYVIEFEKNLLNNIIHLNNELKTETYKPIPLKTFILRDQKTRKISKSDFRDRIVHHALINIIELIFDKSFIYDSCANRTGKGNLFAINRFDKFKRKISSNGSIIPNNWKDNNYVKGYILKADVKRYFYTIDHNILIEIIKRKIKDEKVIWLIKQILNNLPGGAITKRYALRKFNFPILC